MDFNNKKEDYLLQVNVIGKDDFRVENLRCKLYLPKKYTDKVLLHIYPIEEQILLFSGIYNLFWKFSVRGETKGFNGNITHISADSVYSVKMDTTSWGEDVHETIWIAEAIDLKVRETFKVAHTPPVGNFWFTPSVILDPLVITDRSTRGNVTVKVIESRKFTLANGLALNFQTHFATHRNESGDDVTSSYLVGESDLWNDSHGSNKIDSNLLKALNDFLLITSFATRQRCACVGWEAYDLLGNTKFYRRNITIPEFNPKHSIFDGVIHPQHFEEFLQHSYTKFVTQVPNDLLRDAMYGVTPREDFTVEANFIRLFSAIETLVLLFRREHNLEYIFSDKPEENQWGEIENDLRGLLKSHPLLVGKENATKRKLIYENFSGLQRISFSYAFKKFCEFYALDLSDLWAISGGGLSNWSLTTIRNKLVHGDKFTDLKTGVLGNAALHLQWTLERMILAFLEWDISKSFVSREYLSQTFIPHKSLEKDRKFISEIN